MCTVPLAPSVLALTAANTGATHNFAAFLSVLSEELASTRATAPSDPTFAVKAARVANGLYALRAVVAALAAHLGSSALLTLIRGR